MPLNSDDRRETHPSFVKDPAVREPPDCTVLPHYGTKHVDQYLEIFLSGRSDSLVEDYITTVRKSAVDRQRGLEVLERGSSTLLSREGRERGS